MKTKVFFLLFLMSFSLVTFAQTKQDTSVVSIETKSGSIFSGKIVFENSDSIRINTKDLGLITIAKNEIVNHNLFSVETIDGNQFMGEIIEEDALSIRLKTQKLGEISIARNDIKTLQKVEFQQVKDGKYWFPNPQSTRYFWSPNGYGLKKGEGYYQNIWVLWNQFSYGLSDNFSIGGGLIPTFLFGGPTPVFATAKFSIPIVKNKFNVAGGAIAGFVVGESDIGLGILYGLGTYGSPDANVTIGMGYGYAGGDWSQSPMINFNGMFRISSRGYIITENYVISGAGETVVLISIGGRSILKNVALDYGLIIPFTGYGVEFAFPWLGFTVPFGKK